MIPPPPPDGGSVGPGGLTGGGEGFGVFGVGGFDVVGGDFEVPGDGFGARGGEPSGVSATREVDITETDCEASWAVSAPLPDPVPRGRPLPLLATFAREVAFVGRRAWVEPVADGRVAAGGGPIVCREGGTPAASAEECAVLPGGWADR